MPQHVIHFPATDPATASPKQRHRPVKKKKKKGVQGRGKKTKIEIEEGWTGVEKRQED